MRRTLTRLYAFCEGFIWARELGPDGNICRRAIATEEARNIRLTMIVLAGIASDDAASTHCMAASRELLEALIDQVNYRAAIEARRASLRLVA